MPRASACSNGERNTVPSVHVSPDSDLRFGLPSCTPRPPPPALKLFGSALKSEPALPICAEHSACVCARLGLVALLYQVFVVPTPDRHGSTPLKVTIVVSPR